MKTGGFLVPVLTAALAAAAGCAHRPADAARSDPWVAVRSEHFTLYTNMKTRHAWVLEQLELAQAVLRARFFPHAELREVPVVLFAVDDHFHDLFGDWRRAAVVAGPTGHHPIGKAGVIVLSGSAVGWPIHHVAHWMMQATMPAAPLWFHEGFADYAQTVSYIGDHAFYGRRCGPDEARTLAPVPLRELFAAIPQSFDGAASHRYRVSACMLVHYLRHGAQGQLAARFPLLASALGSGVGGERALAAAYPEMSLADLDRELARHLWLSQSLIPHRRATIPLPPVQQVIQSRADVPASDMMALVEDLARAGRQVSYQFVDWLPAAPLAAPGPAAAPAAITAFDSRPGPSRPTHPPRSW
jgi:hypothetical protein